MNQVMLVILVMSLSSVHYIPVENAKGEQKRAFASFRTRHRKPVSESKFIRKGVTKKMLKFEKIHK